MMQEQQRDKHISSSFYAALSKTQDSMISFPACHSTVNCIFVWIRTSYLCDMILSAPLMIE